MQTGVSSVEQFSLLLELSRAFSALIELEELLPTVIAKTQEVLQAESCALLLMDEERQELFFPVTSDVSPETAERLKTIRRIAGTDGVRKECSLTAGRVETASVVVKKRECSVGRIARAGAIA